MKKLVIILAVLAAAAVAVWTFVLPKIDINGLIKEQIEVQGSKVMGTSVNVGSVDIDIIAGKGTIGELKIANPQGYKASHVFEMNRTSLDLATNSLEPVIVEHLEVIAPRLVVEAKADGSSNIMEIKNNIDAFVAQSPKQEQQTESGVKIPNVAVQRITIKDVDLRMDLTALGLKEYQETLPPITVEGVGTPNGLPPAELGKAIGKKVFNALVAQVKKEQTEKLKEKATKKVQEKLEEKLKNKLGDLFKG
ncbi:AsmA family protein [Flocculibacter collagenilyticus]|uniref:hypothetical protein n=1 Tax=Flocculibacter collagenilyticus TaxID=2744479 RepID=UPI0018F4BFA1|nr:hypothetical protein [Flocculibacter collagenilyticus]